MNLTDAQCFARLQRSYQIIKSLDTKRPVVVNFMVHGKNINETLVPQRFAAVFDRGLMDPYPLTSSVFGPEGAKANRANILRDLDGASQALRRAGKPFSMTLQFMGGSGSWPRGPTSAEIRMMTYLSINGGATGVIYFLGGDMDAPYPSALSVAPRVWGAVRAMATV